MTASPTQTAVEKYLAAFEDFQKTHPSPDWLAELRRQSIARFAELGFPTTRDEEWKYTDITPAANLAVTPVFQWELNGAAPQIERRLPFPDLPGARMVFVNGHFAPQFSRLESLPEEVEVRPLSQAIANHSEIAQQRLSRTLKWDNETFVALNTAFFQDGAFIRIPSDVHLEEPIHVVFLAYAPEGATVSHPRNLILIGNNASAKIIQTYAGTDGEIYLTNSATEIVLGHNARLEHAKIQIESDAAFHVGNLQMIGCDHSFARSTWVNFGGRLVRNNASATMCDPGAELTLNGLVVAGKNQHIDNHTVMDHVHPHCQSHEIYAHVLDGHSNAVFNGKIFVRQDAQKTDAKQSNRSLLLSPDAQINAKPQLEIFADDVKCTHGATIGQLDEDALFYLRARGIPAAQAQKILVRAFADEVLEHIGIESLREALEHQLDYRLS